MTEGLYTRKAMTIAAGATLLLLAVLGLGVYAVAQAVLHRRAIYAVESVGAFLLGWLGLSALGKYWVGCFKRTR